ncbi:class I adenylate-forming enzyme family protein [Telmatospirillum siberiense]|uniref:Long-chain fatty acid--CoA ligase n=1 Tax=Telmatospirillum siberiense TaxID=382514 RepID=A0A2N3PUT9_9PROT|nr:AMP-binding protein [Telmatospirillum siberiense]PKU24166.1 long-chain fatty acid--CoA ligase [Telmatospirillum siberiense]
MSDRSPPERSPLETLSFFPPHDGTLWAFLESRQGPDPDRPFLIFNDVATSWRQFQGAVEQTVRMLRGRGVERGDRVAAMAANCADYVVLFFALARIGAILVPVNPDFGAGEAGYILAHAGVSGVVCAPASLPVVRRAAADEGLAVWFLVFGAAVDDVPGFSEVPDNAPPRAAPAAGTADDICLIMYTSGTTGFPKGVTHSQGNFVMAGEAFVERMHLQTQDRLLCILPLFHINGLFYSLGGAVAAGATLILAPRFSASGFWPLVSRSRATEVNIIAAIGTILARRPREEFVPGHGLVKVYGAPVTAEIAEVFIRDFGVHHVIEGYGMTEIPGACNLPFDGERRIGSMGVAARHPDPAVRFSELRVADDEGRDLPPGQVGELLVRTPIVMKGYYRDPDQTRAAFRDGWFLTGDLVRRDADGYHYFVARRKDIIRRRGENISGAELDRVVGAHPDVAQAAAIGVASDLGEEDILVAVVLKDGSRLTARDLQKWCATSLSSVKCPRYVAFLDALPQTPTFRVAKFKLKQDPDLRARAVDLTLLDEEG